MRTPRLAPAVSHATSGHARPAPRRVSLLAGMVLLASLLSLAVARTAHATATEPYGEVAHFGGYAAGEVAGKFDIPVGFAVEPEDPATNEKNDVYVLDRTVYHNEEEEQAQMGYRLQKLSSSGAAPGRVLGSLKLPVQLSTAGKDFGEEHFGAVHPLIALAVDPAKQRVYGLVESMPDNGASGIYVPVADELVAWSTVPNGKEELEKASGGYAEDSVTHAALVAHLLGPEASKDLYAPEGIAVNPKTHEVVIEAQQGVTVGGPTGIGGPTVLQPVVTEGSKTGELGAPWTVPSSIAPSEEQGDGLFTTSNQEGYGIDLFMGGENTAGAEKISRLATVKSTLAAPEPSLLAEDKSGGANTDEAPTLDNENTVNRRSGRAGGANGTAGLEPYTAGSPITQLANGLYAARYGNFAQTEDPLDHQENLAPWSGVATPDYFWTQAISTNKGIANEGIRLFEADGHIVTTIGGQPAGHECNLSDSQLALAAGAEGSVFALSQPNSHNGNSNDEVIEFAPGGKGACPTVGGHIEVEVNGKKTPATSTVTVTQKNTVNFDAFSLERAGGTPYAFEWYFEGTEKPESKTYALGSEMEAGPEKKYLWPTPEAPHEYKKAGTFEVGLRVTGDYGTSEFPNAATIKVEPTEPAVARFSAPASIVAGTPATFDASTSEPTPDNEIINYHWEFGEGPAVNTHSKTEPHTYENAGKYTVKLKITDGSGETAEARPQEVSVAAKPAAKEESPAPGGSGTGGPPAGTTPPASTTLTPPLTTTPTKPLTLTTKPASKPLTLSQKLAAALKACHKLKSKKQRKSCEKQANTRYAKKAKAKKKSTKKR